MATPWNIADWQEVKPYRKSEWEEIKEYRELCDEKRAEALRKQSRERYIREATSVEEWKSALRFK